MLDFWKSTSGQIQDGGRNPNVQPLNRNNSAANYSISLKFGTWVRYGSGKVTQGLSFTYHDIQDGSRPQILNL